MRTRTIYPFKCPDSSKILDEKVIWDDNLFLLTHFYIYIANEPFDNSTFTKTELSAFFQVVTSSLGQTVRFIMDFHVRSRVMILANNRNISRTKRKRYVLTVNLSKDRHKHLHSWKRRVWRCRTQWKSKVNGYSCLYINAKYSKTRRSSRVIHKFFRLSRSHLNGTSRGNILRRKVFASQIRICTIWHRSPRMRERTHTR